MELSLNIQVSWALARATTPRTPIPAEAPVNQEDTKGTEAVRHQDDDGQGRPRGHRHHHHRGRRHVQREARHLLRDIRHEMRGELKELREDGDLEKVKAVKSAYRDFRDGVQDVIRSAGRGHDFDRGAVAEGLGQAMASFTEALRELNGTAETAAPAPAEESAPVADKMPVPAEDLPAGALLDVGA